MVDPATARSERGEEIPREGLSYPAPESDPSNGVKFGKISVAGQDKPARPRTAGFKFDKRGQLLICAHNETRSVVAMSVRDEDCSPIGIQSCNTAPTPTGFAEIVSDDFPVFFPRHVELSDDCSSDD